MRITPDEVHLSDPDNYEVIYSVGTKYAKSLQFYDGFGIGYSTFSTGPNSVHRVRRGRLDPFFSRRNVINLEHIVQSRAEKLTDLVSSKLARKEAVDMHHAFRAISVDVITDYAFGESYHLLDTADLGRGFFEMVNGIGPTMWVFQQWPFLQKLSLCMPSAVAKMVSKSLKHVLNLQEVWLIQLPFLHCVNTFQHCRTQVLAVKAKMDAGENVERSSIFEALLTPADGYVVPTPDQIKDEAYSVLVAAADTTGNAMTVAAYNVVKNPDIYRALVAELKDAFPNEDDTLKYSKLEKLPYLVSAPFTSFIYV